jgi:cell pole-organizing protein PopZ
MNDATR